MTNDKKKNPLAKRTAEQVKKFLSQKNAYVFYTLTSQLPDHQYAPIQIPKIPSQSRRLSLYGTQMKTPSKKQRCWNSKDREGEMTVALKDNQRASKELHPNRFKLCKLKEHHLASRKLKSISSQKKLTNPIKGHAIDSFDAPESEGFVKDERMEYWEDFIHNREERHFNIGRIIKYLST